MTGCSRAVTQRNVGEGKKQQRILVQGKTWIIRMSKPASRDRMPPPLEARAAAPSPSKRQNTRLDGKGGSSKDKEERPADQARIRVMRIFAARHPTHERKQRTMTRTSRGACVLLLSTGNAAPAGRPVSWL